MSRKNPNAATRPCQRCRVGTEECYIHPNFWKCSYCDAIDLEREQDRKKQKKGVRTLQGDGFVIELDVEVDPPDAWSPATQKTQPYGVDWKDFLPDDEG